jgi:hypothetical protein
VLCVSIRLIKGDLTSLILGVVANSSSRVRLGYLEVEARRSPLN